MAFYQPISGFDINISYTMRLLLVNIESVHKAWTTYSGPRPVIPKVWSKSHPVSIYLCEREWSKVSFCFGRCFWKMKQDDLKKISKAWKRIGKMGPEKDLCCLEKNFENGNIAIQSCENADLAMAVKIWLGPPKAVLACWELFFFYLS